MRKLIRVSLVESTLYQMQNKGEKIMFEDIPTILILCRMMMIFG